MARSIILGNGGLTVGLDENGLVHDFYYPYVGLENLTTARSQHHHIGIWVDGEFSWIHEHSWQKDIKFHTDALVSDMTMTNEELEIGLHFEDFVDPNNDVFARRVRIRNMADKKRELRIFFHQVFQISALGRADTAMYVPDGHYILDYKGRCSILAYAETESGSAFDQYAVGNAGIEGKEGTYRDAEDGDLSMSAVEHASVDSTLRISTEIERGDSEVVHYWLAVSDSQDHLETLHEQFVNGGINQRLQANLDHWHDWLAPAETALSNLSNQQYIDAVKQSLLVISAHTDKHGGIIASCDSSIYNYGRDYYSYVWPRDGAFIIWPLIKLGYTKEPRRFFEFCASIIHRDGYLKHKYQPDRAVGSTWHPLVHNNRKELAIQEDETAVVVFMLGEYLTYSGDQEFIDSMYEQFIRPAADFMCRFIDDKSRLPHASYDLWEEKFLTSTYTTAVTYRALLVAADIAKKRQDTIAADRWSQIATELHNGADYFYDTKKKHLIKGFLLLNDEVKVDTTLDISSFYGSFMFDYAADHDHIDKTLQVIEQELLDVSPTGGSARYEDDAYFRSSPSYRGNPWFVTTLWLAQFYALAGHKEDSIRHIDWALEYTTASGLLSEQINPTSGQIISVTPLVWSHAELINAILFLDYGQDDND